MDIWVVSGFGVLWTKIPGIFVKNKINNKKLLFMYSVSAKHYSIFPNDLKAMWHNPHSIDKEAEAQEN